MINLNPPVKPLDLFSEELVNKQASNVIQNQQIIYKEVVPAPLPAFSQKHIVPIKPANQQIINFNPAPIFSPNKVILPAQNVPQPISQPTKIEYISVKPNFEPRPAVIPQPQNVLPPSKPEQTKYETFETVFNQSKLP